MGPAALWLAVVAGASGAVAATRPADGRVGRWAVRAVAVAALAAWVAVGRLAWAFWSADFSLAYVADHARRGVDRATRVSGVWGGMAGSLLFYAVGIGTAGLVAVWRAPERDRRTVAATAGIAVAALVAVVALWSDPFTRLQVPATDGAGLTPILEHPAMRYHPPLLYAGLTSLLAPFALTVAALARRALDEAWAARVARWLLVPWVLLAVGMLAGAHWAYVELGWGGYWAWDPVENTALLPWLAVTATLHGLLPTGPGEDRGAGARRAPSLWAAAGVAGAFLLSILGGLLTRSGTTSSVHAFAEATAIGRAFSVLLLTATASVAVLLVRARRSRVTRTRSSSAPGPAGLRMALAGHQILVLGSLVAVLVGSLWPLVADLRDGDRLAVEGWYFAALCGPLAVAGLALMGVGPLLVTGVPRRTAVAVAGGAAVATAAAVMGGWDGAFALAAAPAAGAACTGVALGLRRAVVSHRPVAPHLAHLAVVVLLVGVAGTTTGTTELHRIATDGSVEVQGHRVVNHGVRVVEGTDPSVSAVVADVTVDGHRYRPELVAHRDRRVLLAESALRSTPVRDVQLMLRDADDGGGILLQVGVHPLQQLVWWGGLLLLLAGAAALASRRRSHASEP